MKLSCMNMRSRMRVSEEASVIYSKHVLELKHLPGPDPKKIREGFGRMDIRMIKMNCWNERVVWDIRIPNCC